MVILFDIGGSNMRVASSIDGQTLVETKIIPTPLDFEEGIKVLKQISEELSNGQKVEQVSGGIASPLDKDKSCLVISPNIKGWINKPLKLELEKTFNCKVILENDTTAGGLGEATKGAGVGKKVVAYLALGTGVGGKRIVDGKIDESSFNFEPGHQIIVPSGNLCNCGGKGHLEAYVGGSYIEKTYGQKAEDITDPLIWDGIAKYLSVGLSNTAVHWSPDIIILGGSVSQGLPLEKVNTYLEEFLTIYPTAPQVVLGTLGHDAGFYGALELLKC